MRHGDTYTCKRMRLLSYLKRLGFLPFNTLPDPNNPRFNIWQFHNTPELEKAVEEYFFKIEQNKIHNE